MVLGAVTCPKDKVHSIFKQLRAIKVANGFKAEFEIKWTKVSPAKEKFYKDVIEYFFSEDCLSFRGLIIPDKAVLKHDAYNQNHDLWYYKMYFLMLNAIISPKDSYNIYLDIKDTNGGDKTEHLHNVLCNSHYDFNKDVVRKIQQIRSEEVELVQVTDLLIGAIGYHNRNLSTSSAKLNLIKHIQKLSGYSLTQSTLIKEPKLNLFRWLPRGMSV